MNDDFSGWEYITSLTSVQKEELLFNLFESGVVDDETIWNLRLDS